MPFNFKLSRRLALTHILMLAALVACGGADGINGLAIDVAGIAIAPDSLTLDTRQTVQFSVRAAPGGTSLPVTWSATGGTINPDGTYISSETPGTYEITAADGNGNVGRAKVWTVKKSTRLVIVPGVATVGKGAGLQFRAYGISPAGDSVVLAATFNATGGTITTSGQYSAGSTTGSYRVIATANGLADTAAVTISATTPPPPPSAAECATPRAGWIWCDDFEQDRLSSYFEYDNAGGNFVRANSAGYNGSVGMRVRFAQGAQDAGYLHLAMGKVPSAGVRTVDAGTANYREVYWRMYVKHQSGWVGGGGDKLSRAFVWANSNWSQAAIGHVWSGKSPGANQNFLVIDPARGTDPLGNLITTAYNDFSNLEWIGQKIGSKPVFDAAHVGQWYCVEAHMKLNTALLSNGVFELWVNGALEAQETGLNFLGGFSTYGINAVYFENYWNAGSAASQERYFDNIVVSTARIGC